MLGSITIYGGSKGMVAMPNLSGLSRDSAIAAIQSAGLVFTSSSNVDSTSGNNGKVVSQSITAGVLLDYESPITIGVGLYTAPVGPVITYVTDTNADGSLKVYEVNDGAAFCVTTNSPYLESQKRKYVYLTYKYIDGVKDTTFAALESPTADPVAPTITTAYSANCGWSPPPAVTCGASYNVVVGAWSTCDGYHERSVKDCQDCTDGTTICGSTYKASAACCITVAGTTSVFGCSACRNATQTCTKTYDSLCGSTTTTHTDTNYVKSCTGGAL